MIRKENGMTTTGKTTKQIFRVGKYYVADKDNYCTEFSTITEAKAYAIEDTDVILYCMNIKDNINFRKKENKAKKIIIDFDKNNLTVEGESVTLSGVTYLGNRTSTLSYNNWQELLANATFNADDIKVIGNPPLEDGEKDITNEVSNL